MGANLKQILTLLISVGAISTLSACNYYELKAGAQNPAVNGGTRSSGQIDYASIRSQIIAPSCLGCHSSRPPAMNSYADVKANLDKIHTKVITEQSMPPASGGGALSPQLQAMLNQWIAAGAPETVGAPLPSPTPSPSAAPSPSPFPALAVDYEMVRTQIIEPSCIRCHATRAPVLNSYTDVKANLEMIYTKVVTEQKMPPARNGTGGPLSAQLQNVLAQWRAAGAPETLVGTPDPTPSTSPSPVTPGPVGPTPVTPSPAPSASAAPVTPNPGPTSNPPVVIITPGPTASPSAAPSAGPSTAPSATPSASPSPTIPGIVRPVTFTVLKQKVIQPNCASCHGPNNDEGNTDLTDYDSMMSVVDFIEGLTTGVAHTPNGDVYVKPDDRMPPSYAAQLTREQEAIILLWIQDGKLGPAPTAALKRLKAEVR